MVRHADSMLYPGRMFFLATRLGHGKDLILGDWILPRRAEDPLKDVEGLQVCDMPSVWGPCFCPVEQSTDTCHNVYSTLGADLQVFVFKNPSAKTAQSSAY